MKLLAAAMAIAMLMASAACSQPASASKSTPSTSAPNKKARKTRCRGVQTVQRGKGVWYGGKFHGRKTASGERFDKNAMTAAHKKLPFGTVVRVTNLRNKRSVKVRITDRGPYSKGRIIDVSEAAARKLAMIKSGVVPVKIEVIELPPGKRARGKCR